VISIGRERERNANDHGGDALGAENKRKP
jgi:hypothetical protein